ncbi:MAG: tRNA glutamyl-Q(34) synthetase GluQRS [Candidatus Thiodiazotropha sp. (ex Epidulcina cf. delphinae)]|nr:tRNA glutamyl-Q(34) synthetase GluQRS [Candidatus Thiodiazotropha sp. (ex Epidulcina cf. delphinae)]
MTEFVTNQRCRGRFAPSPTGPLHFGSLVAALGSYLDARRRGGEWLVRMEDLDRTREVGGSAALILHTLEGFGFRWDDEVLYQSRRTDAYDAAVDELTGARLAYPCGCSRKAIGKEAETGVEGPIYPGACRKRPADAGLTHSIRVLTDERVIKVSDAIQGPVKQNLAREIGDFVIRRADGFHAYQLAVVVDDAWQGITHIVRGADLLNSTPRQCYLQQRLGLPRPGYAHLPLAVDGRGRKLSKQHRDAPVDPGRPLDALLQALAFLHQPLPPERPANLDEFWQWSIAHWSLATIPVKPRVPVNP